MFKKQFWRVRTFSAFVFGSTIIALITLGILWSWVTKPEKKVNGPVLNKTGTVDSPTPDELDYLREFLPPKPESPVTTSDHDIEPGKNPPKPK